MNINYTELLWDTAYKAHDRGYEPIYVAQLCRSVIDYNDIDNGEQFINDVFGCLKEIQEDER